jgi:D-3-phosphoglycerate dehydrogenase
LKEISVLFAPLGYYFGEDIFLMAPALKVVASNTTGVPHIDVPAAEARGINVFSLKDEVDFLSTITPTAELTFGLIIAITRNMVPAAGSVLNGSWSRWEFGGQAMLSRMSLGIVGLGRLGKMVARYAAAFGMTVSYYDPFIEHDNAWTCARTDTLEQLLSESDIVTVHIPMNNQNRHLFSEELFMKFRRGSYFINTARGEVVDSEALVEALESGILRGAAVDVLDGEFASGFSDRVLSHQLVRYAKTHPNLLITPHIAGSTEDAWYLTQRLVIERTIRYMKEERRG